MRDIFTKSGLRSPNDVLVIQLERLNEDQSPYLKKLYLDPADQTFMFNEFMCRDPPSTSSWVFDRLKNKLERTYPNLVLQREDLHIGNITHYIGYLNGLWETQQPPPEGKLPVQVYSDVRYGINILVGTGTQRDESGGAISFNPNEQRLVYNLRRENKSILQVHGGFVEKLLEESPLGFRHDVSIEHVDVLLVFMERQVEEPPDGQGDHWRRVTRPYEYLRGDLPTACHERFLQSQSTLTQVRAATVQSSSSSSSSRIRGRSQQPQSSDRRDGQGGQKRQRRSESPNPWNQQRQRP